MMLAKFTGHELKIWTKNLSVVTCKYGEKKT